MSVSMRTANITVSSTLVSIRYAIPATTNCSEQTHFLHGESILISGEIVACYIMENLHLAANTYLRPY